MDPLGSIVTESRVAISSPRHHQCYLSGSIFVIIHQFGHPLLMLKKKTSRFGWLHPHHHPAHPLYSLVKGR